MSGKRDAARSALTRIPLLHSDFHDQILNALDAEGLLDGPAGNVRAQATKVTQLSSTSVRAMARLGFDAGKDKIEIGALNDALAKSGMTLQQRFQIKAEMAHAGLID